jgi:26S proteasome regulatory subunit N7
MALRAVAPAEKEAGPVPDFRLADKRFLLSRPDEICPPHEKQALKAELMDAIKKDAMAPFYRYVCESLGWPKDEALLKEMEEKNTEELNKIADKIADAKENLGDSEVLEGMLARAEYYSRIGDKTKAMEAYDESATKTVGVGGRLDNQLARVRLLFFYDDLDAAKKHIALAEDELVKGAEWERRNKLKVYKGLYHMMRREIKEAAQQFLGALATFTATEVVEHRQFIFYTVITSMVSLDRKKNKDEVISSPEVQTTVHDTPHLKEFMTALHGCKYSTFFAEFPGLLDQVLRDRRLSLQYRYVMRHLRLNAYRQFLTSYKSVTIAAMASAFGVGPDFIDTEIASFIASGQIACKIDKVHGIIESNSADSRNESYVKVIKEGDVLLSRMQKLSKVIDM